MATKITIEERIFILNISMTPFTKEVYLVYRNWQVLSIDNLNEIFAKFLDILTKKPKNPTILAFGLTSDRCAGQAVMPGGYPAYPAPGS